MCRRPTTDFDMSTHKDAAVEPVRKPASKVFKIVCAVEGCGYTTDMMGSVRHHYRMLHNTRRAQILRRQQESLLRWLMPMLHAHEGMTIQNRPTLVAECLISHDIEDVGVTHEVTPLLVLDYPNKSLRVVVETHYVTPGMATRTISNDLVKITEVCATMYTNGQHSDVCWIKLNLGVYQRGGVAVQPGMKERAAKLHAFLQCLSLIPKPCGEWGVGIAFLFYDCDSEGGLQLLHDAQISSDMRSHIKYWLC